MSEDVIFVFIKEKNEEMVDLVLSVLLLLFKSFPNYALFCDMEDKKKAVFLQCVKMNRRAVREQSLTLLLISILRTQNISWFYTDFFTDSILHSYASLHSVTQILISNDSPVH